MTAETLSQLLEHPRIWRAADSYRAHQCQQQTRSHLTSGYPELDEHLPGHGWPADEVTELLIPQWGHGELRLVKPALATLSQQQRWIVWVSAPWKPYAPGLAAAGINIRNILVVQTRTDKQTLWAMETCLQSGSCSAVLGWPQKPLPQHIKRLQIAAQNGNSWCLLMRHTQQAQQPSPAPLRIELSPGHHALQLRIIKCRGHWGSDWITITDPSNQANLKNHVSPTPESPDKQLASASAPAPTLSDNNPARPNDNTPPSLPNRLSTTTAQAQPAHVR